MILTDDELQAIRQSLETYSHLDEELKRRCHHLLHLGAYDEAVRTAFVLLEERLKDATGQDGLTGSKLADYAFNATNGPLSKHIGQTPVEREGLRELFAGAFKLFRNPTAHGAVNYDAPDGKAIIGLVNLLLRILERARELPAPGLFSGNLTQTFGKIEEAIGPGGASRLRQFVGKCLKLGLQPSHMAKQWIPLRRYALTKMDTWDKPRPHRIAIFYLGVSFIHVPVSYYYSNVIGFDLDRFIEELNELGFHPTGKEQEPRAELALHNDKKFFDGLLDLIVQTNRELERSLQE